MERIDLMPLLTAEVQMLEQLDLTDDGREALKGACDAIAALIDHLADIPTLPTRHPASSTTSARSFP
ncbi:hypothetical protein ACFV1N_45165 [Streptosporangium canum]|uniref:hypothetical protein n=1 Tax=Streptosporangium canum TaxID=324952 RepID=UPI00369DC186